MYKVVSGDTFSLISRKVYGVETKSSLISNANPGVIEPLVVGATLVTPVSATDPENNPSGIPSADENEIAIIINGERYRFWTEVRITTVMDTVDTVEFVAPFDPSDETFRSTFVPFSFASVVIYLGGFVVFKGVMVDIKPNSTANSRIVSVSCYSDPGVLMDCTIPASVYDGGQAGNEYNGQSLREIATTICQYFGITVKFNADAGAVFKKVAINTEDIVWDFLADLASQRGLIMTNGAKGELIFYKETAGAPVANVSQGSSPVESVTPAFRPRQYFSHVTGVTVTALGRTGSQLTINNNKLRGVNRPFTFTASKTDKVDMNAAVSTKIGRMFGNSVSYAVDMATWKTPSGTPWVRGSQISLTAPDAMIYNKYDFTIKSAVFTAVGNARTATLELVLPGSFEGKIPEVLPWET